MSEEKLRNCPFCGGEACVVHDAKRKLADGKQITGTVVSCTVCNATMFYRNSRLAIEAWNRRVPQRAWTQKVYDSFGKGRDKE